MDVEVPALGGLLGPFGGEVGHEPGDGFLDEALHRGDADAVREGRDLAVDERDGFGERDNVNSAIRRARQTWRRPARIWDQVFGSRYFSSTAWAM